MGILAMLWSIVGSCFLLLGILRMDRQEIGHILSSAGLRPQHKYGQNFMVDQNTLHALADAGNLTRVLSTKAARGHVIAVDIDRKLMPAAQRHHGQLKNITWLNADVLAGKHEINPEVIAILRQLKTTYPHSQFKLISNLPYNAASPIIAELLVMMCRGQEALSHEGTEALRGESSVHSVPEWVSASGPSLFFSLFAFTVQWEVAERMRAKPDTSDYGPLSILINLMAEVQVVRKIPPGVFWPAPKVHSALVVVIPSPGKIARIQKPVALQQLLSGIFSHRRQTLHNALKHYLAEAYTPELVNQITRQKIDLKLRPENITQEQFLQLAGLVSPTYDAAGGSSKEFFELEKNQTSKTKKRK
jgi:16S rRNA (adenine1518-N6/adenine1519-N6)-dimethyltransferase